MNEYNEYEILQIIRKKPLKYLEKLNLHSLNSYILGYLYHIKADYNKSVLNGFTPYIANIYNINTTHNWADIITFYSNNEEEAFYKFYNHLDEFLVKNKLLNDEMSHKPSRYDNYEDNLYETLLEIKKRPGLFLGEKSLERLYAFINGYNFYKKDNLLDGFAEYVRNKYKIQTNRNYSDIIYFFTMTECDAFDKFFVLLDEFLNHSNATV